MLRLCFIDFVFSSKSITPSLLFIFWMVLSIKLHPLWFPTGQSFCSLFDSPQNSFKAFPLKPENWAILIYFGIPCVSMHDRRSFNGDFPPVDLVTFTDGNFEN